METSQPEPKKKLSVVRQLSSTIFELDNGDFVVAGVDATEALDPHLPDDAARASYERTVIIERDELLAAKRHIPDSPSSTPL